MVLEELYKELKKIAELSSDILKDSGYDRYGEVSVDNIDRLTADERQIYRTCCRQIERLGELQATVKYLSRNIEREGIIHWNHRLQRYEFDGIELHCGDGFEVLLEADGDESEWIGTRIEKSWNEESRNQDGYYLVGLGDTYIEGLQARRRG